ncbi:hypothetical protein ACTI_71800 [Actinoplanes sp. OR16]|uniref:GNAT family N-acetyltransferase n=1 Tax=Actinoplanes sp. OR16 TaxID=946334 RepID=UPI000F70DFAE|nr:GNAT family N-acetyltransferase [Actinoplanes sp. OR16]BBH70495.1 hypothetical protein ACTI_71800 [Actinoplanes sp. OR16]
MTTIVPIDASHPAFAQLAALFDDYRVHYGRPSSPDPTRAWLRHQLSRGALMAAAAVESTRLCGFITTTTMPASLMLSTAWSIRDLYVSPPHRGRGMAQALVNHVIADAREAGALRVSLQTESENVAALALYTKSGFQPVPGLDLLNLSLNPEAPPATNSGSTPAPS